MASNFYRQNDSPRYILGHALELGFIGGGIIAAFILLASYAAINRKRRRQMESGGAAAYSSLELSEMGDKAVTFRYIY